LAEGEVNGHGINGDLREEIGQQTCAGQGGIDGGKAQGVGLSGC
jgi:hypothetical protein